MVYIPDPLTRLRVRLFPASAYLNLLLVSSLACSLLAWIYSNMQAGIEKGNHRHKFDILYRLNTIEVRFVEEQFYFPGGMSTFSKPSNFFRVVQD